ncbi:hypothetical protein BT96DRAFT_997591 [Gymnopus androsaceus JB14]|uniref:Uncharacterized protein n=1 Tax=Gymnopus androsaceus JB14 TaxID=1447944 RepID=A0A6A4HEG7_9AGAR|nr:hypothetical protein BT96DRAFT_997591 [Gymnopus androsaceus JB14]
MIHWMFHEREIECQDNSSPSPPMADFQQSSEPLTDSLRLDILLLSSYLSGMQNSPSEHHPKNTNLQLFVDISMLLAIGNSDNFGAKNVNAVIGQTTTSSEGPALELLVCIENARQDVALVQGLRPLVRGIVSQAGKGKGMRGTTERKNNAGQPGQKGGNSGRKGGPAESVQIVGEDEELGSLLDIEPNMENGRKLLNNWGRRNSINKAVNDRK